MGIVALIGCVILIWFVSSSETPVGFATVPLRGGDVLIVGGVGGCSRITQLLPFCERDHVAATDRYSLVTGHRVSVGAMNISRFSASLTTLSDGRILVAGGQHSNNPNTSPVILASAEIFDPATHRWHAVAPMNDPHYGHTATLLADGRVLICGFTGAEIYDPTSDQWKRTGPMGEGHVSHTATLLLSGKVLIAGGDTSRAYHAAAAEMYDPADNIWKSAPNLLIGRSAHSATRLPDGRVLIVGGSGQDGFVTPAEIYDPATNHWSPSGSTDAVRYGHIATLLTSGQVLIIGGSGAKPAPAIASIYDPETNHWQSAPSTRAMWANQTAVVLSDGRVLLAGGWMDRGEIEIYAPTSP